MAPVHSLLPCATALAAVLTTSTLAAALDAAKTASAVTTCQLREGGTNCSACSEGYYYLWLERIPASCNGGTFLPLEALCTSRATSVMRAYATVDRGAHRLSNRRIASQPH